MSNSKIQDHQEALRWFEEDRTYAWMVEQYQEKYHIETSPSMWAMFRRRQGLPMRIARDDALIPWSVKPEHRWDYPIIMLRMMARRRAGFELTEKYDHDLDNWLEQMKADDTVVHYDPDTAEGWFYVPRRAEVDVDLIRVPDQTARLRHGRGRRASEV